MFKKFLATAAALVLSAGASYALFSSSVDRIVASNNSVPVVSACGTGALATGSSDTAGEVTATGATGCTLTFGTAYASAPSCVTLNETVPSRAYTAAITATAITLASLTAADKVSYICIAKNGG